MADHFEALERVHEECFEPTHGPWCRAAVGRFLDCGLLEHGFARVRCGTCRARGERDAVPGVIACVQTFGSLAHRHPLHVLMTDGAFRRDGRFVPLPPPDPAVLEEL